MRLWSVTAWSRDKRGPAGASGPASGPRPRLGSLLSAFVHGVLATRPTNDSSAELVLSVTFPPVGDDYIGLSPRCSLPIGVDVHLGRLQIRLQQRYLNERQVHRRLDRRYRVRPSKQKK